MSEIKRRNKKERINGIKSSVLLNPNRCLAEREREKNELQQWSASAAEAAASNTTTLFGHVLTVLFAHTVVSFVATFKYVV